MLSNWPGLRGPRPGLDGLSSTPLRFQGCYALVTSFFADGLFAIAKSYDWCLSTAPPSQPSFAFLLALFLLSCPGLFPSPAAHHGPACPLSSARFFSGCLLHAPLPLPLSYKYEALAVSSAS